MSNCVFGFPVFSDPNVTYSPTFTGGTWSSTLTLANLQDRRLGKVARSTAVTLASTQFDLDLKTARGVSLISIPKHTLSLVATIRIRGSTIAGDFSAPVYDTGQIDVFPVIYPTGTLPVGHASYATRKLSAEDLAEGYNIGFVHIASAPQVARYWRIEINDTTNAAGYIDLARLVLAATWQPSINMEYGAKLGWETSSTRTESDGGAAVFNERPRRRIFSFQIGHLPQDEAFVSAFEIQRRLGTTGQVLFVFDPADVAHMHRRSFLAVLKELSALDFPYHNLQSVPFALVEEL